MSVDLYVGDSAVVLKELSADSIDLTVTSPPYDNLRKYNGYTFDFEAIARELYRVTKPGGVVVWVVGDATIKGSETGTSFKQALYFKEIGFNLHDTMIYETNKPPMNDRRYQACFEFMFVFSKGKPVTFNPLKRPSRKAGTKRIGTTYREANNTLKEQWRGGVVADETILESIWYYPTGGVNIGHPAIFPESLARDHILSWSNEGDTVLDPFMGSGTTGKMAILNKRNFIGIDISWEYFGIASLRIAAAQEQLV
jgi:site-specific DNA-methyltransferase (adenine-specific)